jgi:hypothetical protein
LAVASSPFTLNCVPVISWAQAGNWQELCANFQYGGHEEYVETDSKGVFALKLKGDKTISGKPCLLSFAKTKEKQRHPQSQQTVASHLLLPHRTSNPIVLWYHLTTLKSDF